MISPKRCRLRKKRLAGREKGLDWSHSITPTTNTFQINNGLRFCLGVSVDCPPLLSPGWLAGYEIDFQASSGRNVVLEHDARERGTGRRYKASVIPQTCSHRDTFLFFYASTSPSVRARFRPVQIQALYCGLTALPALLQYQYLDMESKMRRIKSLLRAFALTTTTIYRSLIRPAPREDFEPDHETGRGNGHSGTYAIIRH
ncbi:hypothetical protein B0J11DRAFT_204925 [Dendryphion nanum]|uniref:Uncharacterized protein n=1 Tax=Dendryphion nanum TaxID=256645 RepID=A0A9P9D0Q5_9PLEO|nr:hypothetical protein B0J11DRAFT_204925 [Dendryphion nanum]